MTERPCPFCAEPTRTSVCACCASALQQLGVELPPPEASRHLMREWVGRTIVFDVMSAGRPVALTLGRRTRENLARSGLA